MVGEDRLSFLPEGLLTKILSRVDNSRTVVRTSKVSRRWRTAWKDVRVANLLGRGETPAATNRFRRFCTSFMLSLAMHPNQPINSFLLSVRNNGLCDFSDVRLWLETAIHREVQNVCIFLPLATEITLPLQVFSCTSLVSLKLENIKVEGVSDDLEITLPNLRILHLYGRIFQNPEHLRLLLKKCPNLEYLILDGLRLDIEDLGGCFQNLSKVILSSTSIPLNELWNVKFMRLSHLTPASVILGQLTHLDLSLVIQCNWFSLLELLSLCPVVHTLKLRCSGSGKKLPGLGNSPIPNCIRSGLMHCTLTNFSGPADVELVTLLMKNARKLRTMTIWWSSLLSENAILHLVAEVCEVRRLSPVCDLKFH